MPTLLRPVIARTGLEAQGGRHSCAARGANRSLTTVATVITKGETVVGRPAVHNGIGTEKGLDLNRAFSGCPELIAAIRCRCQVRLVGKRQPDPRRNCLPLPRR